MSKEIKEQRYLGKVTKFNEVEKTVECIVLHFDKPNENYWMPEKGCLDNFLARLEKAKKNVPVCYQHDQNNLIGQMKDWSIKDGALYGTLYLDDIPFVREVVLVQLKSGTLQGSSPTIAPISDYWDDKNKVWAITEGALCEVSLVGLPADLKADILEYSAKLESARVQNEDKEKEFEINLLTI